VDMDYDAVVVGGGVSGLLSALVLGREGKSILLLERAPDLGGNLRSYDVDGFRVDTGPHAITHIHDGPLTKIMDEYFTVKPSFVPYGRYFVRSPSGLTPFPWTMLDWARFGMLPAGDRFLLAKLIASSLTYKKLDLNKSLYDVLAPYRFSDTTLRFADALSYFMSGRPMAETPAWRMLKGARYMREDGGGGLLDSLSKVKKLFFYEGAHHQGYPLGGVGSVTDAIIRSFPKGGVNVEAGVAVSGFILDDGMVSGVETDSGSYSSESVVYTGCVRDLPGMAGDALPEDYCKNLKSLKQATSITLWLGLSATHPKLGYKGGEIWFTEGKPYWAMPTSNLDPALAPEGGQLIGFTSYVEENAKKDEKALKDTIFSVFPKMEDKAVMEHTQITHPEKAAITVGAHFPPVKSPLPGLYLAGTDTDTRSMGATRAAYSVLKLREALRGDGII